MVSLPRPQICTADVTRLVGVVVLAGTLAACATGKRPRLVESELTGATGPAAEVANKVAMVGRAEFTASYDAHVTYGDLFRAVTTTQDGHGRRSLTIGEVRYLVEPGSSTTCTITTGDCENGHNSAFVSDMQMTSDFLGTTLAAKINNDVATAVGDIATETVEIAGGQAECIEVPLPAPVSAPSSSPTSTYCVFDNGVLARLITADLQLTLTDYAPTFDDTQFATVASVPELAEVPVTAPPGSTPTDTVS